MKTIPFRTPSITPLEKSGGLFVLPTSSIGKFYEHIKGIGDDVFLVKLFRLNGIETTIKRGHIPPESRLSQEAQGVLMKNLEKRMAREYQRAVENDRIIHEYRDENGLATIFAKSNEGYLACGWVDSTRTRKKATLMCTFVLYAFNLLNQENDEELFRSAGCSLIFDENFEQYEDISQRIVAQDLYEIKEKELKRKHG